MSRIARGAVTIVDINDGSNPISAVLTNQNHTFPANENGTVTTATRNLFSTGAIVYIGNVLATLSTTATLANNTYRIKPVGTTTSDTRVTSGTGWTISVNSNTGLLTVTAVPTTNVTSCTVAVIIEYKDPTQTSKGTIELTLTLSRVNEGAGGSVVNLSATSQTFFADFGGAFLSTGNSDIIVGIETGGSPGAQTYEVSQNGNSFVAVTTASDTIGGIKGFDEDLTGNFTQTGTISTTSDRLLISKSNLGTNDTYTIKVSGANGGVDVVTIMKVREGDKGAAAINVSITSSTGGTVFKNNSGTSKTLSVVVTDAKDGTTLTPTSYQWLKNGAQINVTSSSTRTVVSTGGEAANGAAYPTIIVGPEDVTDNSAEEFSCIVTVPD
jgi:hypothetical protein